MNVIVYLKEPSGGVTSVTIMGVEGGRYEKANRNSKKPDVLTFGREVEGGDWSEYKVVAEFHTDDVVGWAESSHLPEP